MTNPARRSVTRLAAAFLLLWAVGCSNPEKTKQAQLVKGQAALEARQFGEAILAFRNVLKIDNQHVEARQKLAEAYQGNGDTVNAARETVRVADLLPNDVQAQLKAARYLILSQQFEDAATRARRVTELEPMNVDGHLLLGSATAGLKDIDGAIKQLQEAINIDPSSSVGHANMGALLMAQGRKVDALASLEKAVTLNPTSIEVRLALATYHLNAGALADAELAVKAALAISPASGAANRAMALLLIGSGRAEQAEPYVQSAAKSIGTPDAQLALADYYIRLRKSEKARPLLETLRQTGEVAHLAEIRLALLDYTAGQQEAAHKRVDGILQRLPANPEALVVKGHWLLRERRPADALRVAETAVKSDPSSVSGFFLLGQARVATGNRKGAEEAFNEVLRINPRAGAAQTELARLNIAAGRMEAAVQFAQDAVKNQPANVEARILLVRGLIARRDVIRAEAELTPLVRALPQHPTVRGTHGLLLMAKGDHPGARREYEAALALDTGQIDALTGLTVLDAQAGQLGKARERLGAQLQRTPKRASLLLLAARADIQARDWTSSEHRLREALAIDPSAMQAYELLARTYLAQRKLDQARQEFEGIAARDDRSVAAHTMIGIINNMQNRADEAEKAYRQALEADPRAAVAANNLAYIYADRNQNLEEALALARNAADILKDHPAVQDTLGWVYLKKGQAGPAVTAFEASVQREPGNALFQYHLGLAYAKAGELDKAKRALGEALRLDPSFDGAADARRVLASLQS